ncbi:MAG: threonylcarbamoyl-AMP synthase [Rhizobiales bacterium]|nr:L-threonylcarbamoyladenylate synthase [Hyphomicrobiales bacterium]NRB13443.1 threonylcarbamoyl-AMP synthase [Hyphomicrobiales bacterium]
MVDILRANQQNLKEAGKAIRRGELVAFPTETVYGLGADATNDAAVSAIYKAKGRPSNNPLIVHITTLDQAYSYGEFDDRAKKLAVKYWPGPMSLIVKRSANCPLSHLVSAGGDTVALRMPAHPISRQLLEAANVPVAAPSANISGGISPTLPAHVKQSLGDNIFMLIDGGACLLGVESSVISALPNQNVQILRPGSVDAAELSEFLAQPVDQIQNHKTSDENMISPGLLSRHYAPKSGLRMNVAEPHKNEAYLAFGAHPTSQYSLNLSPTKDLVEAAKNLFAMLHKLDDYCQQHNCTMAAAPIPNTGLGIAINDRLRRASAAK